MFRKQQPTTVILYAVVTGDVRPIASVSTLEDLVLYPIECCSMCGSRLKARDVLSRGHHHESRSFKYALKKGIGAVRVAEDPVRTSLLCQGSTP